MYTGFCHGKLKPMREVVSVQRLQGGLFSLPSVYNVRPERRFHWGRERYG
jgi:hypothetical protein